MQEAQMQSEAARILPAVLAALLDESEDDVSLIGEPPSGPAGRYDALLKAGGRRWIVQIKGSSSPGVIAKAADQLRHYREMVNHEAQALVVVPYMSDAGAKVADERGLDWIDLSGNARLRNEGLHVHVEGKPNRFPRSGRPSTPFAPKSARVSRSLLLDPWRWWRQKDLAAETGLDDGMVSRVVRRLDDDGLLAHRRLEFRPRDPELLLDAWADDYRFDRHILVSGHMTGEGVGLAESLHNKLKALNVSHAFTGLPAAWAFGKHARFRLVSVYVGQDPHAVAETIDLRLESRGANVQLIKPDDEGAFAGLDSSHSYPCVSPVQTYLDLLHLPERAAEAAEYLRSEGLLWGPNSD